MENPSKMREQVDLDRNAEKIRSIRYRHIANETREKQSRFPGVIPIRYDSLHNHDLAPTMIIATRTASFVPTTTYDNHIRSCILNTYPDLHHVPIVGSGPLSSLPSLPSTQLLSSADVAVAEMDTGMFLLPDSPLLSPLLIAVVALVLLVSAQSFINKMLEGDQGLGAFLRDGAGYNRSGFRPRKSGGRDESKEQDPLPWMKLPRLDFVEVAGQNELPSPEAVATDARAQQKVYDELESLRLRLNNELESVRRRRQRQQQEDINDDDDMTEAKRLQTKLEDLMKLYGVEYETE
eukprot:jgi/Psemu1/4229/gm1.4229_g